MQTDARTSMPEPREPPEPCDLWVLVARIEWGLRPPGTLAAHQQPWLSQLLESLETMLRRRFADEEAASPLYREVPVHAPALVSHVEALRREHATLLGWLHRLVEVGRLEADPVLLATLTGEVRDLLRALRRHEHAEENALDDAVLADLPATD